MKKANCGKLTYGDKNSTLFEQPAVINDPCAYERRARCSGSMVVLAFDYSMIWKRHGLVAELADAADLKSGAAKTAELAQSPTNSGKATQQPKPAESLLAPPLRAEAGNDTDLAAIVKAWPSLSPALKARIAGMVEGASTR